MHPVSAAFCFQAQAEGLLRYALDLGIGFCVLFVLCFFPCLLFYHQFF